MSIFLSLAYDGYDTISIEGAFTCGLVTTEEYDEIKQCLDQSGSYIWIDTYHRRGRITIVNKSDNQEEIKMLTKMFLRPEIIGNSFEIIKTFTLRQGE